MCCITKETLRYSLLSRLVHNLSHVEKTRRLGKVILGHNENNRNNTTKPHKRPQKWGAMDQEESGAMEDRK